MLPVSEGPLALQASPHHPRPTIDTWRPIHSRPRGPRRCVWTSKLSVISSLRTPVGTVGGNRGTYTDLWEVVGGSPLPFGVNSRSGSREGGPLGYWKWRSHSPKQMCSRWAVGVVGNSISTASRGGPRRRGGGGTGSLSVRSLTSVLPAWDPRKRTLRRQPEGRPTPTPGYGWRRTAVPSGTGRWGRCRDSSEGVGETPRKLLGELLQSCEEGPAVGYQTNNESFVWVWERRAGQVKDFCDSRTECQLRKTKIDEPDFVTAGRFSGLDPEEATRRLRGCHHRDEELLRPRAFRLRIRKVSLREREKNSERGRRNNFNPLKSSEVRFPPYVSRPVRYLWFHSKGTY